MSTPLFVFTTTDAEYVLGHQLRPGDAQRLTEALNRDLTQYAANIVLDVAAQVQVGPAPDVAPVCPRCGHFIPRDEFPGEYPGAISRLDNVTEVCSICGIDEALGNGVVARDFWPVKWHAQALSIDQGNADRIKERLAERAAQASKEGEEAKDE